MIGEEKHFICESRADPYVLITGIVLALVPFAISLMINIRSKGIPDKFLEFNVIAASMTSSFWVLLGTLPAAGMIGQAQPNAHAYLLAASVMSFVLPLSYNIAQTKLQNVTISRGKENANSKQGTSPPRQMMRTSSNLSTSSRDVKVEDDPQILNAADDKAVMSNVFDTMGSISKAVDINRDILTLFKVGDDVFSWETGFTLSEVYSLGPKSLETVIKMLIGSSKLWQRVWISNNDNNEAKRRYVKCCMDALDIFEKAPAKSQLRDRRIIFPCYSTINVVSKTMTYTPPNNMSKEDFETTLAQNFAKETSYQQYHHCRALAFQADITRRQGKYEEALLIIDKLKSIYDPQLHSRVLVKEYVVTDNCGDMIAMSTVWLRHFGRNDEALQLCDHVVDKMLPEIEATELVTKLVTLTPICHVMVNQDQGQTSAAAKKALELFRTHISDPAALAGSKAHPALAMRMPMMIILKCRIAGGEAYTDFNADAVYMLNRKDLEWFEVTSLSYSDAAWSTTCAEAFLCLARITGCNSQEAFESELIKEGLKCLEVSINTLTNEDGAIVNEIAHSYYSQILSELENLNAPV